MRLTKLVFYFFDKVTCMNGASPNAKNNICILKISIMRGRKKRKKRKPNLAVSSRQFLLCLCFCSTMKIVKLD